MSDVPLTLSFNLERYASGSLFSLCLNCRVCIKKFSRTSPGEKSPVSSVSNVRDTPYPQSWGNTHICRFFHKSSSNAHWHKRQWQCSYRLKRKLTVWKSRTFRCRHFFLMTWTCKCKVNQGSGWRREKVGVSPDVMRSFPGLGRRSLPCVTSRPIEVLHQKRHFPWTLCEHLVC